ncbi:hypothetical protein [Galbibacter pacificus]|uniref:DUF4138 domain-containing protein n=1 Tax=Galbibacter pacificus TaxID=2996052 RepID=A0ABT6FUT5_9FLAO|nr:hypothetical protein [Galbibacter pacificus]MDG3583496.1 hypothetical protein [Galbibacter pacificus]MDG3587027.1 hypothetical protein [Galbibacter pacificus]
MLIWYCFAVLCFQQGFSFKIVNKTPYAITNIRLYEYDMHIALSPNEASAVKTLSLSPEKAEGSSVLMLFAENTNYGIYIENPQSGKKYTYVIDSIQPKRNNIFISTIIEEQK